MSESVGYGPPLPLTGGTLTGALTVPGITVTTTGTFTTILSTGSITTNTSEIVNGANGSSWTKGSNMELLTLSTTASTDTAGNILPANSVIEGVSVYVVTTIPTAATFTVGDANVAARFASIAAVSSGTSGIGITMQGSTGANNSTPQQTAAAKVRITPSLTPATPTGQVRIVVFYQQFAVPTS